MSNENTRRKGLLTASIICCMFSIPCMKSTFTRIEYSRSYKGSSYKGSSYKGSSYKANEHTDAVVESILSDRKE